MTTSTVEFVRHPLFGGALTCLLPVSEIIDTSTLRSVPDHQEVFLARTSLTSIVFEINTFQTSEQVAPALPPGSIVSDEAVAQHHLLDTVSPPDSIKGESVSTIGVVLGGDTLKGFAALHTGAIIKEPVFGPKPRSNDVADGGVSGVSDQVQGDLLPPEWQTYSPPPETVIVEILETRMQQLLIRMEKYDTDLCIRISVPMKEYKDNAEQGEKELKWAGTVMNRIIESLEVVEFSLFGGEEDNVD